MNKIAIIGATGATGLELVKLALNEGLDPKDLCLIASEKSVGKSLIIQSQSFEIKSLSSVFESSFDVIFLAAGSKVSAELKDKLSKLDCFVIDLSSKFRQDQDVPLIIPEINHEALNFKKNRFVSSPNCVTTLYLMVLAPLFKKNKAKKVILSTYQAASGAGFFAMEELKKESEAFLNDASYEHKAFQDPYAFNLFAHNAPFKDPFDNEEEIKIRQESQKILNDPDFKITATCVRVPTLRAHAISAYVEFSESIDSETIYSLLDEASGIKLCEDFSKNKFATPQNASCKNEVYYGRIRKDPTSLNCFWFWIVGDQLLKGAALNAWQIYQLKRSYETLHAHSRTTSS